MIFLKSSSPAYHRQKCHIINLDTQTWIKFPFDIHEYPSGNSIFRAYCVLWTKDDFWIFWIMNFSGFLIRVLLDAYKSALLRILLVFTLQDINWYVNLVIDIYCVYCSVAADALVPQGVRSSTAMVFNVYLCLVISVYLSFDCTGFVF